MKLKFDGKEVEGTVDEINSLLGLLHGKTVAKKIEEVKPTVLAKPKHELSQRDLFKQSDNERVRFFIFIKKLTEEVEKIALDNSIKYFNHHAPWTIDDIKIVKDSEFDIKDRKTFIEKLLDLVKKLGRTPGSIIYQKYRSGKPLFNHCRPWNNEDREIVKEYYDKYFINKKISVKGLKKLTKLLGRTKGSIVHEMSKIKDSTDGEYKMGIKNYRYYKKWSPSEINILKKTYYDYHSQGKYIPRDVVANLVKDLRTDKVSILARMYRAVKEERNEKRISESV